MWEGTLWHTGCTQHGAHEAPSQKTGGHMPRMSSARFGKEEEMSSVGPGPGSKLLIWARVV